MRTANGWIILAVGVMAATGGGGCASGVYDAGVYDEGVAAPAGYTVYDTAPYPYGYAYAYEPYYDYPYYPAYGYPYRSWRDDDRWRGTRGGDRGHRHVNWDGARRDWDGLHVQDGAHREWHVADGRHASHAGARGAARPGRAGAGHVDTGAARVAGGRRAGVRASAP